MAKDTAFFWGWNDRPLTADLAMTRQRAAVLLRAWRRTSRKATSHGAPLRNLQRIGAHTYRVTQRDGGESAVMLIVAK